MSCTISDISKTLCRHRQRSILGFSSLILISCGSNFTVISTGTSLSSSSSVNPNSPVTLNSCISQSSDLFQTIKSGADAILCPNTVINLDHSLVFTRDNQKIYTLGKPIPQNSNDARATLVVNSASTISAIRSDVNPGLSGLQISNIIIDGNRKTFGATPCSGTSDCAALISLGGTSRPLVNQVKVFDARGWSHLWAGSSNGVPCDAASFTNNQVGPGGDNMNVSDGISVACPNSTITGNQISDVTDGGIVLFGVSGTRVAQNTIHSINRDMNLAIGLTDFQSAQPGDFTNTMVEDNIIDASASSYLYVGIAIGNRLWFGNQFGSSMNFGGVVRNNRITGKSIGYAIPVSGASQFIISNNTVSGGNLAYDQGNTDHLNIDSSFSTAPTGSFDHLIYHELFLTRIFRNLLGRNPDFAGLGFYISNIGGSRCTQANLQSNTAQILNSPEAKTYLQSLSVEQIVTNLYISILNRLPDSAGLAFYSSIVSGASDLVSGATSASNQLFGSSEFAQTVLPLVCR